MILLSNHKKSSDTQLQKHLNSWFFTWLDRQPLCLHGGCILREAPPPSPPSPSYCYMTYLKLSVIVYLHVCVCMSALTQAHGKQQTCTLSTKHPGQGCCKGCRVQPRSPSTDCHTNICARRSTVLSGIKLTALQPLTEIALWIHAWMLTVLMQHVPNGRRET